MVLLWTVCFVLVASAPFIGSTGMDSSLVFWRLRLPRVLTAFVAGAGLSLCGVCYQGLFRNVLATPYTLGVSGGASLAVALVVRLHLQGAGILTLAAFVGSLGAVALIGALARLSRRNGSNTLLLAGVAVSFFFSSLIMFIQHIGTPGELSRIIRWMMGSLDVYDYGSACILAVVSAVGGTVIWSRRDALNLLTVGEEFAASRGVSLRSTMLLLHAAVSLTVSAVVAVCGPIGFVGMVCPHIGRLMIGAEHRRLLPVSGLLGGTFLVVCDAIGRVIVAPSELPVGIVTALLGGPFFLWMLLRQNGQRR